MIKRFVVLAAAATLFLGADHLMAQCTHGAASCADKDKAGCCSSKKASLTELKMVTKDEVKSMIADGSVMLIDARDADAYAAGHIDGAINFASAKLPTDKNAKLIFYCGGVKCPAAGKAARKAMAEGYTNVMVFHGGWAEWSANS